MSDNKRHLHHSDESSRGDNAGRIPTPPQDAFIARNAIPPPVPDPNLTFEEEFARLQRWFLEEGKRNLAGYRVLVRTLADGTTKPARELFYIFHNIKGSGGSYEYSALTRIADYLELYVRLIRDLVVPASPTSVANILHGIDILEFAYDWCLDGRHDELPIDDIDTDLRETLFGSPVHRPA